MMTNQWLIFETYTHNIHRQLSVFPISGELFEVVAVETFFDLEISKVDEFGKCEHNIV